MSTSWPVQRALGVILAALLVLATLVAWASPDERLHRVADAPLPAATADRVELSLVGPQARDRGERRRVASRSAARTLGPRQLPAPTAPDAACRLDLGYGVWPIDVTAARTLTTLAAVAFREGAKTYRKAAKAFDRHLLTEGRRAVSPDEAEAQIFKKRPNPTPRTTSLDAIHALFRPGALWCAHPRRTMPVQPMESNGLTLRTIAMVQGWAAAYGGRPLGGFAAGGIHSGHIENSAHYDGRAVDIFFSLDDPDNRARGWLLSHWLVAHADYHQIATVIFDDQVWALWRGGDGWRPYVHPSGNIESPTLRHLDHIHVDVVRGVGPDPNPQRPDGEAPSAGED